MPQFIDIGCNLAHDSFDNDRSAVIERAVAEGVGIQVVTGADLEGSRRASELAVLYPGRLYSTAGVHPHHAQRWTSDAARAIETLSRQPEVVAVGECGLDYFRDLSPRDVQRRAFAAQLDIAARLGKPAFLHQREAHADFVAVLREHVSALAGAVAHCFTDREAELDDYLELGLSIGITGWISDERRGRHLAGVVARIPADRLLIETDAPYLLPRDLQPPPKSRRNEPMYLPHIARAVAAARSETLEHIAQLTSHNAKRLFRIP